MTDVINIMIKTIPDRHGWPISDGRLEFSDWYSCYHRFIDALNSHGLILNHDFVIQKLSNPPRVFFKDEETYTMVKLIWP